MVAVRWMRPSGVGLKGHSGGSGRGAEDWGGGQREVGMEKRPILVEDVKSVGYR